MSKELEKYVAENRAAFDTEEPSMKLWDGIKNEIEPKTAKRKLPYFWMAASFVLLACCAVLLWQLNQSHKQNEIEYQLVDNNSSPLNPELAALYTVEQDYAEKSKILLSQLAFYPEAHQEVNLELEELNAEYNSLKQNLYTNGSQEEVLEAMISNYKYKLEILEQTLTYLKQSEKHQKKNDHEEYL